MCLNIIFKTFKFLFLRPLSTGRGAILIPSVTSVSQTMTFLHITALLQESQAQSV